MEKLLKFGFIGVINTGITIGAYALLIYLFKMNYIVANIVAYLLGMINSYIWNKNWVFKVDGNNFFIYIKFIIVNLFMLGFNSVGLFIFVNICDLNKFISQILVVGIGMFVNFFLTKTWTFAQRKPDTI